MTRIACPSCGFSFETAATTNTRCRRCGKVVRIGSSSRHTASYADARDLDREGSEGGGWVLALLAAGAAFVLWLGTRGN